MGIPLIRLHYRLRSAPVHQRQGTVIHLDVQYDVWPFSEGNVIAEAKLSSHLDVSLRYAALRYFDRDTISSGLQAIHSPTQNDIVVQARIAF